MKTKIGVEEVKDVEVPASPPPNYSPHTTVVISTQAVEEPGMTCWYVFSILSTIFCCLPCGVIGLVHAMVAKHEGERGNRIGHRRRLNQAKCWTSWSIALGILMVILVIVGLVVVSRWGRYYGHHDEDSHKKGGYDKHGDMEGHHGKDNDDKDDDHHDDKKGHHGKDDDDDEEWKHNKDGFDKDESEEDWEDHWDGDDHHHDNHGGKKHGGYDKKRK